MAHAVAGWERCLAGRADDRLRSFSRLRSSGGRQFDALQGKPRITGARSTRHLTHARRARRGSGVAGGANRGTTSFVRPQPSGSGGPSREWFEGCSGVSGASAVPGGFEGLRDRGVVRESVIAPPWSSRRRKRRHPRLHLHLRGGRRETSVLGRFSGVSLVEFVRLSAAAIGPDRAEGAAECVSQAQPISMSSDSSCTPVTRHPFAGCRVSTFVLSSSRATSRADT